LSKRSKIECHCEMPVSRAQTGFRSKAHREYGTSPRLRSFACYPSNLASAERLTVGRASTTRRWPETEPTIAHTVRESWQTRRASVLDFASLAALLAIFACRPNTITASASYAVAEALATDRASFRGASFYSSQA